MNKNERKSRERRLREMQIRNKQKAREVDFELAAQLEELEKELDLPAEEQAPESVEKDIPMLEDGTYPTGYEMVMPVGVPTSWEELDAIEQAEEQAHELREIGWSVQDLVYNIVRSPMLNPKEKAKAIKNVGTGFEARVSGVMSGEMTEKDLDVLEIEAILAHDSRNTSVVEKALDFVQKKVLSAKTENKLSDAQFALVKGEGENKIRKYPIHDKAHVRNALARAAQMMKLGGEAEADAKAAMPKIRAAAKKMGIEMSMEKDRQAIIIEKDSSGSYRYVGWVSNNFIDWDGDIFSEQAHKEFVEWVDKNKDMSPVFLSWHTPETRRESPIDLVMYENGFLIVSGKLTDEEAAGLYRVQKEYDLGMSHGTFILERDPNDSRVVLKYRMYESSDLPLQNAANPFTDLGMVEKEADMAGVDKLKYLAGVLGSEEKAKAFLEKAAARQSELETAGVEHKEKDETPTPPAPPVAPVAPVPAQGSVEEVVVGVLKQRYQIDDLNAWVAKANEALERMPILEELVKELAGNADQKLAEKIAPPASSLAWALKARASQTSENIIKEDDSLAKRPGIPDSDDYWLSRTTGVTPVQVS